MKRILILLVTVVLSFNVFAQANNLTLKVGYCFATNLKSGMAFGVDYGYLIDERISILFGGDLYYKSISEDANLGNSEKLGVMIGIGEHLSKWSGWHLPLMLKAKADFPLSTQNLSLFGIGGVGYGLSHVSYDKFKSDNETFSESLTYSGFVWQVGGGFLMDIGSRSQFQIELLYNGAIFEKDEQSNRFTRLNSSGVFFRGGINVFLN